MLANLASAAADDNSQSHYGLDPPRRMTADEKAIRLAIVRRAVEAAEALPDTSSRSSLAASLGQLGAFDEAVKVARRIDQKRIRILGRSTRSGPSGGSASIRRRKGTSKRPERRCARRPVVETPPKADAQESRARLALGFVAAKDFDEARKIAETLDASGRAEILSKLARQKLREGDLKWANFLVRRALKDADEFLKTPPPPRGPELPAPVAVRGEEGPDQRGEADPKVKHQAEALIAARSDPCSCRRLGIGREGLRLHPTGGTREGPDSLLDRLPLRPIRRRRRCPGLGPLPPFALAPAWALRGLAAAIFDKEGAEQL